MQTINQSLSEVNINLGRLMSPHEVSVATSDNKNIPDCVKKAWTLCGDISEKFWSLITSEKDDVGFRLSAFTAPEKSAFVIFTIQIREYQTRFILLLGNEKANEFMKTGGNTGIYLSLGKNGGDDALLRRFEIKASELQPILVISKRCAPWSLAGGLTKLQLACGAALDAKTVPSALPNFSVGHVVLNVVLPDLCHE
ncbi:MAG: hypothetical protein ABI351_01125 [Herbaspirillum sp.]